MDRRTHGEAGERSITTGGRRRRRRGAARDPIRIGIVDDHRPVREAIGGLLAAESGLELVGEAETASAALDLVKAASPDVLLLDLGLREGISLSSISAFLEERPELSIIVLTMHDEPGFRRGARDAGAVAYLLKDGSPAQLLDTIRATREPGNG